MEKPQTRQTIEASIAAYRQKFGSILPAAATLRTVKRRSAALPADTRRFTRRAVRISIPRLNLVPLRAIFLTLRGAFADKSPHRRASIIVASLLIVISGTALALKSALPGTKTAANAPSQTAIQQKAVTAVSQKGTVARTTVKNGPIKANPSFKAVIPEGKNIDKLGGWSLISPPDREPVYAFADKIDGTSVTVSEQLLPSNFLAGTDSKLKEMAAGFHADKTIDAAGTTVYIGTSAQGPQSVIFSKNKLLILMRSSATIPATSWAAYIGSFK